MSLQDVLERVAQEIPRLPAELKSLSEDDAKREFIEPILVELGWKGISRLRREYSVEAQKRMKMDYALLGSDRKPVALIEAKAPRENLDKHVEQVLKYAFYEGVDICALTTGAEWWLYLPRERGKPAERRFAALELNSPWGMDGYAETLERYLGYNSLTTGAAESSAKAMLEEQKNNAKAMLEERKNKERLIAEIPRAWRRLLEEPSWQLRHLIEEEVFQAIRQKPKEWEIERALPEFGRSEIPSSSDPVRASVSFREIVSAVEAVAGVSLQKNHYSQRHHFDVAQRLVIYFARKHTKTSYSMIAHALKLHPDLDLDPEMTVEEGYRLVDEQLKAEGGDEEATAKTRLWHREICERLGLDTSQ